MALNPVVVQVNTQQFTQFQNDFNAFTAQLTKLNAQFTRLNNTLNRSHILMQGFHLMMKGVTNTASVLEKSFERITKKIFKWSTLITAFTGLLGVSGLFGVERLANAVLAKRRQAMGLGVSYGGLQSSNIAGRPLLGNNTGNILQNIRMGTGGSAEQLTALSAMGIPFGTKDDADDILDKIMKRIPDLLKNTPKGMELATLNAYGLDKLFNDPADLIRMASKEGREEIAQRAELRRAWKKELDLSPEAQKSWSLLSLQLMKVGAHIQTMFGEKFAKFAPQIEELSKLFEKLIQTLLDTSLVDRLLRKLADWMKQFTDWAKEGKLEKTLDAWVTKIESWLPYLKTAGELLMKFADWLGAIYRFFFGEREKPTSTGQILHNQRVQRQTDFNTFKNNLLNQNTTTSPNAPQTPASPPKPMGDMPIPKPSPDSLLRMNTPANPPAPADPSKWPSSLPVPLLGGKPAKLSMNSSMMLNGKGGNNSLSGFTQMAGNSVGINGGNASITGGNANIASWSNAASKSVPNIGGINASSSNQLAFNTRGGGSKGGADASNWQSTRTASLTIRNVPGANVFMAGAGMAT
jgi:hypothetical protein